MAHSASPRDRMLTLLESLGFSTEVAKTLVDMQLLNKGEALLELKDDLVSDLCKTVRKPGGWDAGTRS